MTVNFALERNDFLQYQLFLASRSDLIRKRRHRLRLRVPLVYLILGVLLAIAVDLVYGVIFILIGLIWYLANPYFTRKGYLKNYQKHIDEHYQNRFGQNASLKFEDESIVATDSLSESKIKLDAITELNETADHFFIRLESGDSLIIPKNKEVLSSGIKQKLAAIATERGLPYNEDLHWEWK